MWDIWFVKYVHSILTNPVFINLRPKLIGFVLRELCQRGKCEENKWRRGRIEKRRGSRGKEVNEKEI